MLVVGTPRPGNYVNVNYVAHWFSRLPNPLTFNDTLSKTVSSSPRLQHETQRHGQQTCSRLSNGTHKTHHVHKPSAFYSFHSLKQATRLGLVDLPSDSLKHTVKNYGDFTNARNLKRTTFLLVSGRNKTNMPQRNRFFPAHSRF